MILLEAAPVSVADHCDSTVFRARPRASYLELFRQAELDVVAITGVDPAPFKPWLLPHLPALPRSIALPALYAATFASAPIDLLFGRRAVERSWHAVFVLTRKAGDVHAH